MSALGDERILFDVRLVFTSTEIKANSYCLMFVWRQWLHCDFVGDSTRWCGLCSWHRSGCTYGSPARPFFTIRETNTSSTIYFYNTYLFVRFASPLRAHTPFSAITHSNANYCSYLSSSISICSLFSFDFQLIFCALLSLMLDASQSKNDRYVEIVAKTLPPLARSLASLVFLHSFEKCFTFSSFFSGCVIGVRSLCICFAFLLPSRRRLSAITLQWECKIMNKYVRARRTNWQRQENQMKENTICVWRRWNGTATSAMCT